MDLSLSGKVAVVCGSTQGIGKAIATELSKLGAGIVLVARNESSLKDTVNELASDKGQVHQYIIADFSKPDDLKKAVNDFAAKNEVHILVNNTGGPPAGPITEATTDAFLAAYNSHLICNHILVQAFLPSMKRNNYGRIINVISTSVRQPLKGLGVSNTTRAAVAGWAKTLSYEVAKFGITVNNVLPGATKTVRLEAIISGKAEKTKTEIEEIEKEMLDEIPAGRFGKAEEIAAMAAFLATPAAAYINGQSIAVDGGRTMAF
jgi:3-oxoacyl-[acyl-carrier protein] reductase